MKSIFKLTQSSQPRSTSEFMLIGAPWSGLLIGSTSPARFTRVAVDVVYVAFDVLLTSICESSISLRRVDVNDADSGIQLRSYESSEIGPVLIRLTGKSGRTDLSPGEVACFRIQLALPKGGALPKVIKCVLRGEIVSTDGQIESIEGRVLVELDGRTPAVLDLPVSGNKWVVSQMNLTRSSQRFPIYAVGGSPVAKSFATEWVLLDDQNRSNTGDPLNNQSSPCYGRPVLAVGNGRVTKIIDGFADNRRGSNVQQHGAACLGNVVVLDVGSDRFAIYSHLMPGSFLAKEGDQVIAGQELARIGNSGASSKPHLQFNLVNASAAIGDSLPYLFKRFLAYGRISDFEEFERQDELAGTQTIAAVPFPVDRHYEYPLEGIVLANDLPTTPRKAKRAR
jgi:murein DD-endopeptidase